MVALWEEVDAALTPIIGKRGVLALYQRSLFLVKAEHPWLAAMNEGVQKEFDLAALRSVVLQQDRATAAKGGFALLQTFQELLTSLVGPSLAERLLRCVWTDPSSGAPAQDRSP